MELVFGLHVLLTASGNSICVCIQQGTRGFDITPDTFNFFQCDVPAGYFCHFFYRILEQS